MTSLARIRRLPVRPVPADDAVILAGVLLKCTRCGDKWTANLGPFSDEIEPRDSRCPSCPPEPPPAAA